MQTRVTEKMIEIDGRRFSICKFTAFTGVKIGKMLAAKILPLFQPFIPALSQAMGAQSHAEDTGVSMGQVIENLDQLISLEGISHALDLVSEADLDYIMSNGLMCCYEALPAGKAQVMLSNGAFGVSDVEYDPMLVLRLVCEAVLWGLGDFFIAERWTSTMKPLLAFLSQNRPT